MKPRGIIIVLLVVLAGVGLLAVGHKRAIERAAISDVLRQRSLAREHAANWVGLGRLRHQMLNPNRYSAELGKIDPLTCPPKFRAAWVDYVQSWERKNDRVFQQEMQLNKQATKAQLHVGAGIGAAFEHPNLHAAAQQLSKEDSDEAWLSCKRVAMDYGVFVPSDAF
jgi:hypothetical protein